MVPIQCLQEGSTSGGRWKARGKSGPRWRGCVWAIVLSASLLSAMVSAAPRSFHIDYSPVPQAADLLAFDLSILSAEADVDLAPKHAAGGKALGYLSLVEVAAGTAAGHAAAEAGVPLLGANTAWDTRLMDLTSPAWPRLILNSLAPALIAKGFDGFFLDTADSVQLLSEIDPLRADSFTAALVGLIKALKEQYPDKEIILNRGFGLLGDLGGAVDGVLIESVYRSFDPGRGEFRATTAADSARLEKVIAGIRAAGTPVYAVDYVAPADVELAQQTAEALAQLDAAALITTPALDGIVLAPIRRELRKILVLYGWDETGRQPIWPIDTMTAKHLQMPLEWMGYECEYLHVTKQQPRASIAGHYAGVIFDAALEFPDAKEPWYVEWALRQRRQGVKLLFAASLPFTNDPALRQIARGLGLRGSCGAVIGVDGAEIVALDEAMMNYESELIPQPQGFLDLRAPIGSSPKLTLRGSVGNHPTVEFEPVFTASWGGVLLDPYVTFTGVPGHSLSLVDPFAFLAEIWPPDRFPAPDPTTRQGLRVLASHVDGDGFANLSRTSRSTICAEVIRDRILKVYPMPVTVSVIEANTRACESGLDPAKRGFYERVARSIFELPNVQAASHTYSHPFVWIPGDPDDADAHQPPQLVLQESENYHAIDYQREIAGSIDYIEGTLLPAGKRVELLLWSGNCRPPAEALRIVRGLGIENMNGGDTVISRRNPWLAAVSPRSIPWFDPSGEELQIFSPNQNEFVYTQHWRGPFFGGYSSVIETFEMTEHPRRLKPVNIYYHFYSATNFAALRALETVHAWAMAQPLHHATAAELAAMNRDCRATQLYRNDNRPDWTVINGGSLRTLRIPRSLGLPSLARSEGVIGYKDDRDRDQIYVHLDGRTKARLVLDPLDATPAAPQHLRLVSSTSNIEFTTLTPFEARFKTDSVNSVTLVLGGADPGSSWEVTADGLVSLALADTLGQIVLELPDGPEVRVSRPSSP